MVFINLFLISFFLSILITVPAAKALALYLNIVDTPDNYLKQHQKTTPYLGGLAIFISLWLVMIWLFKLDSNLIGLFWGTLTILFVGIVDDLILLNPGQKLLGQMFAAGLLVYYGFCFDLFLPFNLTRLISFFWIISLMNAFNLVDVMDGLATTIGSLATSSLIVYAFYFGQNDLAAILVIFLGAQLAFLFYNRPRAQIYLGDAGSMLIGALLAAITLKLNWTDLHNYYVFQNYLIAPIILSIPLIEVLCLILIRKFKHIPFYNGSPDHFKHYLKNKNWSECNILGYVAVYATLLFVYSWLVAFSNLNLIVLLFLAIMLLILWYLVVFAKK